MSPIRLGIRVAEDVADPIEIVRLIGNLAVFRLQALRARDRFDCGIWRVETPGRGDRFLLTVKPVSLGLHLGVEADLKSVLEDLGTSSRWELERELSDSIDAGYEPRELELLDGTSQPDYWQTEDFWELVWYSGGILSTMR